MDLSLRLPRQLPCVVGIVAENIESRSQGDHGADISQRDPDCQDRVLLSQALTCFAAEFSSSESTSQAEVDCANHDCRKGKLRDLPKMSALVPLVSEKITRVSSYKKEHEEPEVKREFPVPKQRLSEGWRGKP